MVKIYPLILVSLLMIVPANVVYFIPNVAQASEAAEGCEPLVFGRSRSGNSLCAYRIEVPATDAPLKVLVIDRRLKKTEDDLIEQLKDVSAKLHRTENRYQLTCIPHQVFEHVNKTHWSFPPEGKFYSVSTRVECQYLWRWIGKSGFDQVLVLSDVNDHASVVNEDRLCHALRNSSVIGMGQIPAKTLQTSNQDLNTVLLKSIRQCTEPSEVHRILQTRSERSTKAIVDQLFQFYGNKLDQIAYIPALAVIAKLDVAAFTQNQELRQQVSTLTAEYCHAERPSFPAKPNGSHLAGHLIFAELAIQTGNEQAKDLVIKAAEFGFDDSGEPLDSMPFHNQMSDAVFMGTPILVAAGRLTGEEKYYQQANRHLGVIQRYCLRDDGLYRHSPLNEAAWGRGNGFPALGLALCLKYLPENHQLHPVWKNALKAHLQKLLSYQDPDGMWHQLIDHPESYQELTSTCMIGYALALSQQQNWFVELDFDPAIQNAWQAVKLRIGQKGELIDVCTGTGKQIKYEEYFYRDALLGVDDRGGAMALLFAVEMMKK